MDKVEQLFIRACKTENSIKNLQRVYRRFYGDYGEERNLLELRTIMVHLVDELYPMSLCTFLRELSSYRSYDDISGEHTPDYLHHIYIMRDRIRWLKKEDIIKLGVTTPARWRNK